MNTPESLAPGTGAFGFSSQKDLEDLNKALAIDYSQPPTEGASALRAYSIDGTLRSVTYTQKHIKFWTRTQKLKAYSTVEEYVKLRNYGNTRAGAFVDAGALPPSQDSAYSRENKNVKYVGTTRAVQHQAMVVETVVVDDIIAQEQINGTIYLLGVIEEALFKGDSNVVAQEWDGIFGEIEREYNADNTCGIVMDLQGADITKYDLTKASNVILNNYGIPNLAYCDLDTMGRINQLFYQNQFIENVQGGVTGGVALGQFTYLPKQSFEYEPDVFLRPNEAPLTVKSAEKAPSTPTIAAAAIAAADVTSGKTFANATNVKYVVVAVNKYGESAGSTAATVAIPEGGQGQVTITPAVGSDEVGYKIYRADSATGDPLFIKRIARADAATTVFKDENLDIPGTGRMLLMYDDVTNNCFKQLVPFIKIPLAIVDASIRWMQLLYGTPIYSTPRKNVLIKNIKLA
jgi:hypothetical protein